MFQRISFEKEVCRQIRSKYRLSGNYQKQKRLPISRQPFVLYGVLIIENQHQLHLRLLLLQII